MKKYLSVILTITLLFVCIMPEHAVSEEPEYKNLGSPELLQHTEDEIYKELADQFDSEDYIIENVKAIYISEEYLEELAFNSEENVFFGFKLSEIQEEFKDTGYCFTLGEDNSTIVKKLEPYDDTFERAIRNIAIGTGVILVCVTVAWATAGVGLTTASLVFASAAKTGTAYALSAGSLGGIAAGVVKLYQTGDVNEALKAAALQGSESFKWGAISGAVAGGLKELHSIHKAAKAVGDATEYAKGSVNISENIPQWRQAELRALNEYGGYDQLTYLDGKLVDFGTSGASRPDVVRMLGDHIEAVEVKYYNLDDAGCLSTLYRELQREVRARLTNLPKGSTQKVILDVTGRAFSKETITNVISSIGNYLKDIYPNIPIDVVGAIL